MVIVAVDTGGTFTDLAAYDADSGRIAYAKSLTTYDDLVAGVFDCVRKAGVDLSAGGVFKHGTTLVINALLQRHGARTALVTTAGFRDILETGRGNRPEPFDLFYRRQPPLVSREFRFEVRERTSGAGEILVHPDRDEVVRLADRLERLGVNAVGVVFLNAYSNPENEQTVANWLQERLRGTFVTHSTALSQEWYEYERTATVAANAYVGPQVSGYVDRLDRRLEESGFRGKFFMMGSNGGVLGVEQVVRTPITLVESGPVGGSIGASAYATALGIGNLIAFDMGGTTAKCALVEDGRFDVKSVYYVGGYARGFPIRGSVIDIAEVGAGGGSIASLDGQHRLSVGPRSAGSMPGPVCYGRGGTDPTVTDANVVLGRIDATRFLGGEMALDVAGGERAIRERIAQPLGYEGVEGVRRVADGIVQIASVTMAGAIKRITVERGRDPRDHVLFAFGGGGPLHAFQIARELHIPQVVIPPEAGNFSALGMLLARVRRDSGKTFVRAVTDAHLAEMWHLFGGLREEMSVALQADAGSADLLFEHHAELRYRGQVHSVLTPMDGLQDAKSVRIRFEDIYRARYGHADGKNPVEMVSLRLTGYGSIDRPRLEQIAQPASPTTKPGVREAGVYFADAGAVLPTRIFQRAELPIGFEAAGPALVEEYGSTAVIGPADRFEVGTLGEIRISIGR